MATPSRHYEHIRPFLSSTTFLGRLPDEALTALMGKGQLKSFAKGAAIYRRGDPGESLMVVTRGRVKLANMTVEGKELVLYYVGAGELIGEVSALDGKERAVDAIALEETDVFVICARELLRTLSNHSEVMMEVVRLLCDKLRIGAAIVEDNTLEMRGRTARGLLRIARRHGRRSADGTQLQLTISQEELGKFLNLSRANVNRQLGHLKAAGVIKVTGTEITVVDEEGLSDIGLHPVI